MMLKPLQNITKQKLILPFYHEVAEGDKPYLQGLYHVRTPKQFEKEVDQYLKYYHPITLTQLVNHLHAEVPIEKPSFLLSFDDGLRGVYDHALPILQRKGLEAMMFVNPNFVGNQDMMYRLKVALLAHEVKKPSNQAFKYISKYVYTLKYEHAEHINEMAQEVGLDFKTYLQREQPYLHLEQLIDMQQRGFQIGGHTMSHPELRFLDADTQIKETIDSINWLQLHLKPQYSIFSFPFTDYGLGQSFYEATQKQIDIYFGGAGLKTESNVRHLQRIPIENFKASAQWMLYYQYIYWLLKSPLGKNHITRK